MTRSLNILALALAATSPVACRANISEEHLALSFSGGHLTDPRDHGRPVVLIAAALGVPTDVFRKAFSGVTPARNHAPSGDEQRQNKQALLAVLGPYGITNEQLDSVSDNYRYRPEDGDLWRHQSAEGYAIVIKGRVKAIKLTNPGYGYTSAPNARILGLNGTAPIVKLRFSRDLSTNGSIASITLPIH